jgi:hypothetical protein
MIVSRENYKYRIPSPERSSLLPINILSVEVCISVGKLVYALIVPRASHNVYDVYRCYNFSVKAADRKDIHLHPTRKIDYFQRGNYAVLFDVDRN